MNKQLESYVFIQYWDEDESRWEPTPLRLEKELHFRDLDGAKQWLRKEQELYQGFPPSLFRMVRVEFHVVEEDGS